MLNGVYKIVKLLFEKLAFGCQTPVNNELLTLIFNGFAVFLRTFARHSVKLLNDL